MARDSIVIDGVAYSLPREVISRINPDGTITCRDCGNHLPPTTSERYRQINILWSHDGIRCQVTERWLSG